MYGLKLNSPTPKLSRTTETDVCECMQSAPARLSTSGLWSRLGPPRIGTADHKRFGRAWFCSCPMSQVSISHRKSHTSHMLRRPCQQTSRHRAIYSGPDMVRSEHLVSKMLQSSSQSLTAILCTLLKSEFLLDLSKKGDGAK